MSAMVELERIIVNRRNMQVLQTIMQSQRASILEKQEAELAMMRHQHSEMTDTAKSAEEEDAAMRRRIHELENLLLRAVEDQRRVNSNMAELIGDYWRLLDGCMEVVDERRDDTRGHKRKLPAAGQLKKVDTILIEHNGKRAKMVSAAMRTAGSVTL